MIVIVVVVVVIVAILAPPGLQPARGGQGLGPRLVGVCIYIYIYM